MKVLLRALIITLSCQSILASAEELYPFGRLFTDPVERRILDNIRENVDMNTDETAQEIPDLPDRTLDDTSSVVRFSGYMQRENGDYLVWINGESILSKSDKIVPYAELIPGEKRAVLRANNQQAILKPGQVWLLEPNEIQESYDYRPTKMQTIKDLTESP